MADEISLEPGDTAITRVVVEPKSGDPTRLFAQGLLSAAEFLRSLAQNDYMIDSHLQPSGERLMQIAEALEKGERPR